jgi:hypothetical protein
LENSLTKDWNARLATLETAIGFPVDIAEGDRKSRNRLETAPFAKQGRVGEELVENADWIVLACSIAVVWMLSGAKASLFPIFEQKLGQLARGRRSSVILVGVSTILARLALLPWLGVPQPSIHDEFSYLLAADTFAHGRLANPPHPLWIFFDTFHVMQHPSYASIYPPAQGAVLAAGKLLGSPWMGVLFSMALMCMALTWMLQGWMPPQWALLGGMLAVLRFGIFSYWMNSYWGGAVPAAGAALVLGAFPRMLRACRAIHLFAFGIGVAALATSRPLEGFIFCAPVAAILLWRCVRKSAGSRPISANRILMAFACILVCVSGFIAYYNLRVTGSPLVFPHFIEAREYITTPVFLWDRARPPLQYANPQFDIFYNRSMPALYQTSWSGAIKNMRDNSTLFWVFFLGPPFSIPLLMLPWLFRDRRMRLPLTQFGLSSLGLLAVVWFHPHYAAPLLATILLLVVQALRHLRTWRYRNRPVGAALVKFIVVFNLLTAPAAFFISRWPALFRFWKSSAEGWLPLIALSLLPILCLFVILASWNRPANPTETAPHPGLEFFLLILFVWQVCIGQRIVHPPDFQFDVSDTSAPRTGVERKFASLPGEHLVLVKYSQHHNINQEFVYNDADIDRAKTVWARDIPGQDLGPLLSYFHDRDVWVLEPDETPQRVYPYLPPNSP